VNVNHDVLTITGHRNIEAPKGYSTHRQERPTARFTRSFALPCKLDPEKTSAIVKHGLLTITMEKVPEAQPRQISVKTS
jgi:HSP20 family protein